MFLISLVLLVLLFQDKAHVSSAFGPIDISKQGSKIILYHRCIVSRKKIRMSRHIMHSAGPGDNIRSATGKRPSLHPTVINTVSEALFLLSSPGNTLEVKDEVEPLQVAVAAGKLAADAIQKRSQSSTAVKGDENSAFSVEESQLISGRVVGVVMRIKELEELLRQKVNGVVWVEKYGEERSFGVTKEELLGTGQYMDEVRRKLKNDPLLRMCRAECLFALFLSTVEIPTFKKLGQEATSIDFLDSDRMEVLFEYD